MNGYYTRNHIHAQREQPYRSRYYPARSQYPDAPPVTAPLRFSRDVEQFERDTTVPCRRTQQTTRVLSSDRRATRGTTNPLPPVSTIRDYAPRSSSQMMIPPETPRSDRKRDTGNTNNISFQNHFVRIVLGIWQLFKDTPLGPRLICIFMSIGLLLLVSPIASAFVQITALFLGPVYIILGIITSFIVIHESLNKKNESGTKPPDRHVE